MIVGIVIGVVLIALVVIMKLADKRDRANGHINRRMSDVRATIRDQRRNAWVLRRPGSRDSARSPHDVRRGNDRYRR